MKRGRILAVAALSAILAACSATPPTSLDETFDDRAKDELPSAAHDAEWVVVESPHFEIYSTFSLEKTRALARHLEQFHALIQALTNVPRHASAVPTRILAFADPAHYAELAPEKTGGFFASGLRNHWMLITQPSGQLAAGEVILHEYSHQVLRHGTTRSYPVWYDEGFAELFSTVNVVHDKTLAIGAAPKVAGSWIQYGEWLPLERILATRSYGELPGDDRSMFYAQSWLLVHYLILDRPAREASFWFSLDRYLDLIELGISPAAAFESVTGESLAAVDRRLRATRRVYVGGYEIAKLSYDRREATSRAIAPGEVLVRLGELQLARGKAASAERVFREALEADPKNARAHAGLGHALRFGDDVDEADKMFRRALALDPADPLNHLDMARYHLDYATHMWGDAEVMRDHLADARSHCDEAIRLDDSLPEVWAILGATHLAPGEDPADAIPLLERALGGHPSSEEILRLLAEARLVSGDELKARELLGRMIAVRGDLAGGQSIDDTIEQIERRRESQARHVGLGPKAEEPG